MNLELRNYLYQTNPEKFTDEEVDRLEWENQMNNIPFQRIKEAEGFNIINTAMNIATGFAEGLTTLPVGEWIGVEQNNTVDSIANSIGSLMGFIGVVPGPGLLGKIGVGKLFSAMGKSEAARILAEAPVKLSVKSLPMLVADKAMNAIERSGIKAVAEGAKFLKSGTLLGDMAQGAAHLGIASAVGAAPIYDVDMETFINERMSGFTSGAIFGAGNRLIGNLFSRGGKFDLTQGVTGKTADDILKIAETDKNLALELIKKSDKANTLARAFSSAIAFGMPSTLRDDPLELQVYEYLLNGYFGGKEMSIAQRKAMEVSLPFQSTGRRALLHPEKYIQGYEELDPEVKRELQIQKELELGGRLNNMSSASVGFLEGLTDAMGEVQKRYEAGELTKTQADNLEFYIQFRDKVKALKDKGVPFDEAEIIEEVTKEQAETGYQEYISAQERDLLKKLVGDISNVQEYAAVEDMAKLGTAMSDLDDYYREKKMNYFKPIFKDIATAALQARGATNTSEAYLESYDMEKALVDAMSEYKKQSAGSLSDKPMLERERDFYAKVGDVLKFDVTTADNLNKKLRSAFLMVDAAEARIPLEVAPTGKVGEPSAYKDNSLKEVIQYAPPAPITHFVQNFRELKDFRRVDGEKIPIHEAVAEKPELMVKIMEDLYSQGRAFYGGKKMDSNLFTGNFASEVTDMPVIEIERMITQLPVMNRKGKQFELINEYRKGLERYVGLGGSKETYARNFLNNIIFWRDVNFGKDTPIAEAVAKANQGDFVFTPVDFNKRTQLFGAFELRIPDELMVNEGMNPRARYMILNAVNKDGSFHGKFDTDYTDKDGEGNEIKSKEHLDGPLFVSQKAYDAMMRATGNSVNTGSAKGSHFDTNSELGLLLGKYAYHVADPKLNDFMESEGLDFVYFDTSAKQKGLRSSFDFKVEDGKLVPVGDYKNGIYESPWENFSLTLTEKELKPGKRETVPAQSGDNIYDLDVQEAMLETFVRPYISGTDEGNKLFAEYEQFIGKDIEKANEIADRIDIEDLSMENRIKLLKAGLHRKGNLQKKLLMDIMNLDEDLESFKEAYQDGIADRENIQYMEDYLRAQGAAAKILTSGDISLATTQLPGIRKYFETTLKKYIIQSYVTPKSRYIHKAVIRPHAFMDFEDAPLERGKYRLAEGLREKIIQVPEELRDELGEEITLGDAWDKYGDKIEESPAVKEMFRNGLVRVPMDSPSGLRILQFDGFVKGQKGTGAFLRPEDMKEIGGADTDIDTVFIMFNNSQSMKKIKDYYYSKKDQRRNPQTGGFIDPKDDLATFKADVEEPLYLFDPVSLYKVNQMAYEGNQLLGPMLSMAKRLKVLLKYYEIKGTDKIEGVDVNGEQYWTAKIRKGAREDLEKLTSSIVNFAADSADGIKLKDRETIQRLFLERIFGDIYIRQGSKKDGYTFVNITPHDKATSKIGKRNITYHLFNLKKNPVYSQIMELDNIFKDRVYKNKPDGTTEVRKFHLNELFMALGDNVAKETLPGYRYKALAEMATQNFGNGFVGWRANNVDTDGLLQMMDKAFVVRDKNGKATRPTEMGKELQEAVGIDLHINAFPSKREKALKTWDENNKKLKEDNPRLWSVRRAEFINDMYVNDLRLVADAMFAMNKYRKLQNLFRQDPSNKAAKNIRDFVAAYKKLYTTERKTRKNEEMLMDHFYIDENGKIKYDAKNFHLLTKEVMDKIGQEYYDNPAEMDATVRAKLKIRNKSKLNATEKEFFEALMLTSVNPRDSRIDGAQIINDLAKKAFNAREEVAKRLGITEPDIRTLMEAFNPENPAALANGQISREEAIKLYSLEKDHKDVRKEYYEQNKDSQWFDKPFISARTLNEYTKMFNHVSEFTYNDLEPYKPKYTVENVNNIFKYMSNAHNDLGESVKVLPFYYDTFAEDVARYTPTEIKNYTQLEKTRDDFKQILTDNPHLIPYVGDMFVKFSENTYGVPRTFNDMTMTEFKSFVDVLKDISTKDLKDIELNKMHYFFMPQGLNNLHATKDIVPMMLQKPVFDSRKNQFIEQNVIYPMSRMEILNEVAHTALRNREEAIAMAEQEFTNNPLIKFLNVLTSTNKDVNTSLLMEYTVQQRLKRQFLEDKEYAEKHHLPHDFDKVLAEIEATEKRMKDSGMLGKEWNIMTQGEGGGTSKIMKTEEILRDMDKLITDFFDKVWKKTVLKEFTKADGSKSSEFLFINPYAPDDPRSIDVIQHYFGKAPKKDSRGRFEREPYTAKTLMEAEGGLYQNPNWLNIDLILDGMTGKMLNKNAINNVGINLKDFMQHQYAIEHRTYYKVSYVDGMKQIFSIKPSEAKTFKDKVRVLNDLWNYKTQRQKLGEDGLVEYDADGKMIYEDYYPHREVMQFREPLTEFAKAWKENYFPKTMHPKAQIEARLKKAMEDEFISEDERLKLYTQYARQFGNDDVDFTNINEEMLDQYDNGFGKGSVHSGKVGRSPSLMNRDRLNPLAGYATSPKVILNYLKRINQEFYDGVGMLAMMRQVDKFRAENKGETGKYWEGFMRNRIRTTFGYPSNFAPEWVNDPKAKIRGNFYHLVTEDYWANKASIFDKFFGITPEMRKLYPKMTDIVPEDLLSAYIKKTKMPRGVMDLYQTYKKIQVLKGRNADFVEIQQLREEYKHKIRIFKGTDYTDKQVMEMFKKLDAFVDELPADKRRVQVGNETIDPYKPIRESLVGRKLASLSNLEGKVSMMALLFHPKSALVNLLTSYQNTISATGFEHFRNASKLEVVGSLMNKKSWAEIEDVIDNLGGIESQYRYEVDLSQSFKSENSKRFFERAMEAIKKNRNTSDATLFEIAKQEGLTEAFVNKSAYFMKLTERMGRKKAWLAHYLKGREILAATKYSHDWDDPWLIQFANRGVAATQFLYHNAARPEFARTSLGKIFTRFQTFAMNSINFRKELLVRGHRSGWQGENKDKFERLLTADLFVLAMASALPFSLFNSVVSPPINYLAELAKYLFGDEETRKMAFFGSLPYPANIIQPLLAPSSRYFTGVLNMFLTGDVERFVDYNLWTWFPFGRIVNDVRKSLENPRVAPERMLGIPFNTLIDKRRKSDNPSSKED